MTLVDWVDDKIEPIWDEKQVMLVLESFGFEFCDSYLL